MTTFEKLKKNGIIFNYEDLVHICMKYRVAELSVFGSAIRGDFNEDSDVDFFVEWIDYTGHNQGWNFIRIIDELKDLLNRDVDIVDKDAIRNPIRRKNILSSYEVIYDNR